MMPEEFIAELEKLSDDEPIAISSEAYEKIELVYTYHPAIHIKQDIAALFYNYGMTVIEDMVPRSEQMRSLENRVSAAKAEIVKLEEEMRALS